MSAALSSNYNRICGSWVTVQEDCSQLIWSKKGSPIAGELLAYQRRLWPWELVPFVGGPLQHHATPPLLPCLLDSSNMSFLVLIKAFQFSFLTPLHIHLSLLVLVVVTVGILKDQREIWKSQRNMKPDYVQIQLYRYRTVWLWADYLLSSSSPPL